MASVSRTPKGGIGMGERPRKPEVMLHCSVCRGEFAPAMLRLSWVEKGKAAMYCPKCDPDMRRGE